jgi:hypothetical protein
MARNTVVRESLFPIRQRARACLQWVLQIPVSNKYPVFRCPQYAGLKIARLSRLYPMEQNQQRHDSETEHKDKRRQKDRPAHFYATT